MYILSWASSCSIAIWPPCCQMGTLIVLPTRHPVSVLIICIWNDINACVIHCYTYVYSSPPLSMQILQKSKLDSGSPRFEFITDEALRLQVDGRRRLMLQTAARQPELSD